MINDLKHRFTLPLLQERSNTLPLEVVGGHGGARDEPRVEAPTTQDEVEGNGVEVESKVVVSS